MKKSDSSLGFGFDPRQAEMEAVIEHIKKQPKRPSSDTQAPSTQAVLDRPKELDVVYQARPIPIIAQVRKDGKIHHNTREISPQEVIVQESLRRKGHNNSQGKTEPPKINGKDKLEKAREAWLYSPGTRYEDLSEVQKAQITERLYYEPPSKVVIKPSTREWLKDWVLNNLVLTFIVISSPFLGVLLIKAIVLLWACLKGTTWY